MSEQKNGTRWDAMKKEFLKSWVYVRDQAKGQWEKLSEQDIEEVEGSLGKLAEKISERYGIARHEAERQVGEWVSKDLPWLKQVRTVPSLRWATIFLVAALAFAFVGFTPITDFIQYVSRILFYICAVGFVLLAIFNLGKRHSK